MALEVKGDDHGPKKYNPFHFFGAENLPNDREALIRCPQYKAFQNKVQYIREFPDKFSQIMNKTNMVSMVEGIDAESPMNTSFSPNFVYYGPMHQPDFYFWSAYYLGIQKEQHMKLFPPVDNVFFPPNQEHYFPMDGGHFHQIPFKMQTSNFTQDFQYFVVIDFEATCDKERNPHPQEIIEFPSVIVNSETGQLEASFQMYVRPTCNQLLSDFCKELTGIQQNQVDKGVILSEALLMHDRWLEERGIKHTNFAVVTWSNWDCRVMLESECRYKRIRKPPYFNRWINLKVPFQEVFGGGRCNLKEAVHLAGIVWEGRQHCGLDDAKNTARLLSHLMHAGFRFSITNSLLHPPADRPLPPPHGFATIAGPMTPTRPPAGDLQSYCHCGIRSSRRVVRKPGPKHGNLFFCCGHSVTKRGTVCPYFEWASSSSPPPSSSSSP